MEANSTYYVKTKLADVLESHSHSTPPIGMAPLDTKQYYSFSTDHDTTSGRSVPQSHEQIGNASPKLVFHTGENPIEYFSQDGKRIHVLVNFFFDSANLNPPTNFLLGAEGSFAMRQMLGSYGGYLHNGDNYDDARYSNFTGSFLEATDCGDDMDCSTSCDNSVANVTRILYNKIYTLSPNATDGALSTSHAAVLGVPSADSTQMAKVLKDAPGVVTVHLSLPATTNIVGGVAVPNLDRKFSLRLKNNFAMSSTTQGQQNYMYVSTCDNVECDPKVIMSAHGDNLKTRTGSGSSDMTTFASPVFDKCDTQLPPLGGDSATNNINITLE
jgi:hypothetical protein